MYIPYIYMLEGLASNMQMNLIAPKVKPQDLVYNPDWVAKDMVTHFMPSGRILEPCKGEGVFLKYLPSAEWCEIREGKDFFSWADPVDWCIGNPPYSLFRKWLEHSFMIAHDIVYLVPVQKIVLGYGQVTDIYKRGWIRHIRWYGTGTRLGWMYGNAIGAVHFQRDWFGETSWSFQDPPSLLTKRAADGFESTPSKAV